MADKYMVKFNEISYSQNIMSLFLVTDMSCEFFMLSIKCVPMWSSLELILLSQCVQRKVFDNVIFSQ